MKKLLGPVPLGSYRFDKTIDAIKVISAEDRARQRRETLRNQINENMQAIKLATENIAFAKFELHDKDERSEVYEDLLRTVSETAIMTSLRACNSNQSRASKFLGLNRTTFRIRLNNISAEH